MVVHTSHIVLCFFSDVLQEGLVDWVQSIAELELAPEQDATFVGKIVQEVRAVRSRSPDSEHVLVAVDHTVEKLAHLFYRHARPESVWWDEVATLRVELMPVDFEVLFQTSVVVASKNSNGLNKPNCFLITGCQLQSRNGVN